MGKRRTAKRRFTEYVAILMEEQKLAELDELAKSNHRSRSGEIRRIIDRAIKAG